MQFDFDINSQLGTLPLILLLLRMGGRGVVQHFTLIYLI